MNKLATFAPATAHRFLKNWSKPNEIKVENLFSKKVLLKLVRLENRCYFCTRFESDLDRLLETKEEESTFLDILNWQPSYRKIRQKNKSNRIDRFEKTDRSWSQ